MNLSTIIETYATNELKSEIEYFKGVDQEPGEPAVTLIQALLDAIDFLDENLASMDTRRTMLQIGVCIGQWIFISDEDYANVQVLGASKASLHPMLDGKRLRLLMNNEALIESYREEK